MCCFGILQHFHHSNFQREKSWQGLKLRLFKTQPTLRVKSKTIYSFFRTPESWWLEGWTLTLSLRILALTLLSRCLNSNQYCNMTSTHKIMLLLSCDLPLLPRRSTSLNLTALPATSGGAARGALVPDEGDGRHRWRARTGKNRQSFHWHWYVVIVVTLWTKKQRS